MNSIVALSEPHASIVKTSVAKTIRTVTGALPVMQAEEVRPEGDREHAAEHEHVAVREVDQLEDAVDERVAQRDRARRRAPLVSPISVVCANCDGETVASLTRSDDQRDDEDDAEPADRTSGA